MTAPGGRAQGGISSATRRMSRCEGKPFSLRDVPRHGDELSSSSCVIIALACVLVLHRRRLRRRVRDSAVVPEEGRPGDDAFIPRPNSLTYFLFYLLRIFKWPESVVLGTVGIPTIRSCSCSRCRSSTGASSGGCSRRPVAVIAAVLNRRLDGRPHVQGCDRAASSLGSEALAAGGQLVERSRAGFSLGGLAAARRSSRRSGCLQLPYLPRLRGSRRRRAGALGRSAQSRPQRRRLLQAGTSRTRRPSGTTSMPASSREPRRREPHGCSRPSSPRLQGAASDPPLHARRPPGKPRSLSRMLSSDGVRAMFDRIAPVYDAMNRAFTMGLDGRWRRLAAAGGRPRPGTACSTPPAGRVTSRSPIAKRAAR